MQALNDQYKEWVKRLQDEKEALQRTQTEMFGNNELLIRRVEQLEQANAALVARNKMLEVLGDKDKSKQVKETAKSRLAV